MDFTKSPPQRQVVTSPPRPRKHKPADTTHPAMAEARAAAQGPVPFLDHEARLAAGHACRAAALHVYLPHGFSVTCCCDPDHIGVYKKHGKECKSPGKGPMHPWKEQQGQLPTVAEVKKYWRDYPIGNVGCALGQVSRLVRVDVDGTLGEAVLEAWSQGDLPPTWEFASSALGRGLLYRWPQDQPCHTVTKSSPDGEHTELRLMGNGSQTVLPPSRHPSGSVYAWVPGHSPADLALAPAPAWLVAKMQVWPQTPRTAPSPTHAPAYEQVKAALMAIPNPGADHDTWLRVGMALHTTGTPWGFDLWTTWSQQYPEKYDAADQQKRWDSFSQAGPQGKQPVTLGTLFHLAQQAGWRPPQRPVPDMTQPPPPDPDDPDVQTGFLAHRLPDHLRNHPDPRVRRRWARIYQRTNVLKRALAAQGALP